MSESTLAQRFRRWYAYEIDANERVWESLDSVPPEARTGEAYQGVLDLFAHMIAARQMWLHRMGAIEEGPASLFPRNTRRRELHAQLEAVQKQWMGYLERVDDAELARVFHYQAVEGGAFESTVEDTLTQLFGHGWYHRGQIATRLRLCGGTPASTDFVFWARRPVGGS